jgi:hypothetical protein
LSFRFHHPTYRIGKIKWKKLDVFQRIKHDPTLGIIPHNFIIGKNCHDIFHNFRFHFHFLSFPLSYIMYRQLQPEKITPNPIGESFTARVFWHDICYDIFEPIPTIGGVFSFPTNEGYYPQKPAGV